MTGQLTSAVTGVQKRSVRIDIVRLLGLVVVTAGHVWTQYPIGGYVAIFFVLAGYLWSAKRTVSEDLRYQSWKLLVPYFAWLGILAIPYFAQLMTGSKQDAALGQRALDLLWGGERATTPFTAFWFMTAIFVAAILFRILMRAPRWVYLGYLAVALVATVFDGQLLGDRPGAVDVGAVSVLFMAAGHAYRQIEARVDRFPAGAAAVIVICGILVASGTSARMTLKSGDFGTPVLSITVAVLIALAAILLARPLAAALPESTGRAITRVVQMGTPIILLHTVPLWLLPNSVPQILEFVAAWVFPISVALLLLRFPESLARRILMPDKNHHLL
ncbi:MAG: acyltransferase 3 [Arthrobacter sp.]|nr:acyltransferase 3 [Arthrobacter sp.]